MNSTDTFKLSDVSKIFDNGYSEKTAFCDLVRGNTISYGEACSLVTKTALKIKNSLEGAGNNILLFLGSGLSSVIGFYGILLSGNFPILVNNKLKGELGRLQNLYGCVITDETNCINLKSFTDTENKKILMIDLKPGNSTDNFNFPGIVNAGDRMLYLFTSGSTGTPKIVQKTWSNIMAEIYFLKDLLGISEEDTFLPLVPTFHIYGLLFSIILPLFTGAKTRIDIPFSPLNILEDGIRKDATIIIGNPALYSAVSGFIDRYKKSEFTHVKYCISSTMALDNRVAVQFYRLLGIKILEIYGSTETGGIAYRNPFHNRYWKFFPYVHRRSDSETSELEVASPAVSLTSGDSKNGKEKNWYSTGDTVEVTNGKDEFVLIGRINQIIKTGGNRVSAVEVENVIKECSVVQNAVVKGVPSITLRGESIVAYVVPADKEHKNIALQVKEYCHTKLPGFKIPRAFIILESLPVGANGKILYSKLPEVKV